MKAAAIKLVNHGNFTTYEFSINFTRVCGIHDKERLNCALKRILNSLVSTTVWYENLTWNLILQLWKNSKIKIRKLDRILYSHYDIEHESELSFRKIKNPLTFNLIWKQTVKFYCRKICAKILRE